ncbi:MAG: GTPase HflX [candidate division Zixibacteria bacterium]|nr:GTPase HflX [candidate division Zixibacteria bacterium]
MELNRVMSQERAYLIGMARTSKTKADIEMSLEELAELTRSAGAKVDASVVQVRPPDSKYYIGKGLVERIKEEITANGTNVVIFDDPLSPAQQRNLENAFEVKVIDRSILILNIFAQHARTAEAKLQVELAQLEYMLPRLTGAWTHFSRLGGGIGTRGPGETQLETDRRQVRTKIASLKKKLEKLGTQREVQRKGRQNLFKVSLIGYTNAGKSTLFNQLTRANVRTANQLFTTLDSTTRVMSQGYPDKIIFTDTVGFIKKLPHQLVASFKSTLDEVTFADLLLHVVDVSDENCQEKINQTDLVLDEIGAGTVDVILIFNKIDRLADPLRMPFCDRQSFHISALKEQNLGPLREELTARLQRFSANRHKVC